MTSSELIAVTGATGGLGGRIARRLADRGITQRLVVRDYARAPELPGAGVTRAGYEDPALMLEALRGASTLLLVSATESPRRVALHTAAVDAAVAAGVGRIVYVSFLAAAPEATFTFARDHWHTEEYIRATGVGYTFLRNSLYQDILPTFVCPDGVLRGPAGTGRFAPVARDDIADLAVEVLLSREHDRCRYDVTGPRALTMADTAAALAEASGLPVRYQEQTLDEAYASRSGPGALDWMIEGWVSSYAAIAAGELDLVSDAVATITGHPAVDFADFLRANPDSLAPLYASTAG